MGGVVLHAVEALPGRGRYAAQFRYADGTSLTAVVHVEGEGITAAEASLPSGWSVGSKEWDALAAVVVALDHARAIGPATAELHDVEGGWDVSLGNVVLGPDGVPTCTAHGAMTAVGGDRHECAECGAGALYAVG